MEHSFAVMEEAIKDCQQSNLPADAELEEKILEKEIYGKISRMELLCAETKDTEHSVNSFIADYCAKMGKYIEQIAVIDKTINNSKIFVQSVRKDPVPSKKTENKYKKLYKNNKVSVENDVADVQDNVASINEKSDGKTPFEKDMKKMYRALVKEFHPDLHDGRAEHNEDMIKIVNHAYSKGNIGSLWKISFDNTWKNAKIMFYEERLDILRHYRKKISLSMDKLLLYRKNILLSNEYELQQSAYIYSMKGKNLMLEIEADLQDEVARKSKRIAYLKAIGRI